MDRKKLIAALASEPYAAFGTGSPAEEMQKPSGLAALFGMFGGGHQESTAPPQVQYKTANPLTDITDRDIDRGMNAAMAVSGGGLSTKGVKVLPSAASLQALPHPSVQHLNNFSRLESVPLSKARTLQDGVGGMNWAANRKGEYAPPLFEGYAERPVAVRKETGEYIILDGNHRTVNALNRGDQNLEMHVIDAKDYAPRYAGVKPAPPSMSDDELLNLLLGE